MKTYGLLKRITALVVALALTLCGVPLTTVTAQTPDLGAPESISMSVATQAVIARSVYYEPVGEINAIDTGTSLNGGTDYAYKKLSAANKLAYTAITGALDAYVASSDYSSKNYTSTGGIAVDIGAIPSADIIPVFYSACYDNPQYFWLSMAFSYLVASTTTLYLSIDPYYYNAAVRTASDSSISAATKQWLTALNKLSGDYAKCLTLHDMIIAQIDYSYNGSSPESAKWAHNIDGVLSGKGAVCEGYAKTYQFILNLLGIDNILVVGTGGGGGHAWNYVKLDGAYYCVDVTWDDYNGESLYAEGMYDYFCTPYTLFSAKHTPYKSTTAGNKWLYDIDSATNDTSNVYYYRYNSYASATAVTDAATASAFISGVKSVNNAAYYVAQNQTVLGNIAAVLGLYSYSYKNGVFGLMLVLPFSGDAITKPITALALDNTALKLEVGGTARLTATVAPMDNDDTLTWSSSASNVVSVDSSGNLTAKRAGTAKITVTAIGGGISASCTVKVSGGGADEPTGDYVIWANGRDVKATATTKAMCYKTCAIPLRAMYSGGKWTPVVTPATESYDTPQEVAALFNESGKLTLPADLQKTLKAVAAASIKDGVLTVKAGSGAGNIRVWIVEIKNKQVVLNEELGIEPFSFDVSVLMGSSAVAAGATEVAPISGAVAKSTVDKNTTVAVGSSKTFYINAMGSKTSTKDILSAVSPYETYSVSLTAAADSNYAYVSYDGGSCFTLSANGLKAGKSVTVKVKITSEQTGKSATLPVTINNPVRSIGALGALELTAGGYADVTVSGTSASGALAATTDKLVILAASSSQQSDAVKLKGTSASVQSGYKTAVLSSVKLSGSTMRVTAARNAKSGDTAHVYLCALNAYGGAVVETMTVTIK